MTMNVALSGADLRDVADVLLHEGDEGLQLIGESLMRLANACGAYSYLIQAEPDHALSHQTTTHTPLL